MSDTITIILPLPSSSLSPNARVHWAQKAVSAKAARMLAFSKTRFTMTMTGARPMWKRARYTATFSFPDRRPRDLDNLMASLKAYLDGIADAGLVANDRALWPERPAVECDPEIKRQKSRGYVRLVIEREKVPEEMAAK